MNNKVKKRDSYNTRKDKTIVKTDYNTKELNKSFKN